MERKTTKGQSEKSSDGKAPEDKSHLVSPPALSLPKGGGAIRGLGEKFAVNPSTGTGSLSLPLPVSPGRFGFSPQLSLSYDSGAGNGPFGLGWSLNLPAITRKTDKGLPRYRDGDESDVFLISGAEDLVPILDSAGRRVVQPRTLHGVAYTLHLYRPRIEGLFARIERWTRVEDGISHWRSITRDNVTTLYGIDDNSRIADPHDPRRIFSYLICLTFDDKGNGARYEYAAEDNRGVDRTAAHEANRTEFDRRAQRYLKSIRYGNVQPYFPDGSPNGTATPLPQDWHFYLVLDYGDHRPDAPAPTRDRAWLARPDPFSTFRPGFEVRTYRRCERALLFHNFPAEAEVGADCLVRSTDFHYSDETTPADPRNPIYTFLESVTQIGYRRTATGYVQRSTPPLEFFYSQPEVHPEILTLTDSDSRTNLPEGLDGARFQWVDLDGEGLSGILSAQNGGWGYKRNLSPINRVTLPGGQRVTRARFGPLEMVPSLPVPSALGGGQQLLDLSGGGRLALAAFDGPTPGFFKHTPESDWEPFQTFDSLPRLNWSEPNLKFVDLTGDGRADVLITEDDVFTFYPSLGEDGFGEAERVLTPWDEARGPRVVFADGTQTVSLADLSGDGLSDIVRVRNGEVCYWPNLGYGRFGAKVTMDNAPRFTDEERFDPRRIRWADVDGSGTTDLLYIGDEGVQVCFNRSGNAWAVPHQLAVFPGADNLSSVQVADLLGNGTACLVWSSPLPGESYAPLRYVDLMGSHKPHLMVRTLNNLGAETRLAYAPSTRFYLEDKRAGRPWITRLPFPVHVVERVETYDWIGRSRFVTRYAYHHGYFDGDEREFRGFGMVEQWDTESHRDEALFPDVETTNEDAASFIPPVLTRTWFHTGAYLDRSRISRQFESEYYRDSDLSQGLPGLTDAQLQALLLDDTVLPDEVAPEEAGEACRALKGAVLRQEIYSLDGTEAADRPYSVSEQNYTIERLQPRGPNQHAVFFTHPREALNFHYERQLYEVGGRLLADPRLSHTLTLEVDPFGNVLKSVAIGYGRRRPDPDLPLQADRDRQTQTLLTYTESRFTHPIAEADAYRTPLPCETLTYELTGYPLPAASGRFQRSDFVQPDPNDADRLRHVFDGEIRYEEPPTSGRQRRLIEQARTLYRKNDLTDVLPLGAVESRALPFESYQLAFTPDLVDQVYGGRVTEAVLADEGRYVHSQGDAGWWIPSGRSFYSPDPNDAPTQELAFARQHFFLPRQFRDPFGNISSVRYDLYDLLILETEDPLQNKVTTGERDEQGNITNRNDYRVLQPTLVTDPNRNRAAVAFDALGMVVGTAVMGKIEENQGDSLAGFEPDLDEVAIQAHLQTPLASPGDVLQNATTRLVYDLFAYYRTQTDPEPQPGAVYVLARETHAADLPPGGQTKIQHSFSYSDGFGREIQKKIQAEPGPLAEGGSAVAPRWVGSGWTIFNNKGKPVRQYEPFFSPTHQFEFAKTIGVSAILFYDPVGRVVATLHPNHTYEKVVFDPWRQATWDVNDTVLQAAPNHDPDVGDFFQRLPASDYVPTWHAQRVGGGSGAEAQEAAAKAAVHAATPTVAYFDTLGRVFLTLADNGAQGQYATRVELDIEGNQRAVRDALGRTVMAYDYDLLSTKIHQHSMDAGERRTLNDVAGKPIRAWDSRDHQLWHVYDSLHRPTHLLVQTGSGLKKLAERIVYGEAQPGPAALNLRGKVFQQFDGAGVVTHAEYDFKGNLLYSTRQLLQDYRAEADWSQPLGLENETFASRTKYDALNRPQTVTAPDGSVFSPTYNEANLLEQMAVNLRGAAEATPFVTDIDYNAKGQRDLFEYANGVRTAYTYDPDTFRLSRLRTSRPADNAILQDLRYTYDPAGNITDIRDDSQQTLYFNNQVVEPRAAYVYDAVYRLMRAEGREHIGQQAAPQTTDDDGPRLNQPHPGDGQALRRYAEQFEYDAAGNILQMIHQATNGSWTRAYAYDEPNPEPTNNRLTSTTIGGDVERYAYDAHGNMLTMPHLQQMDWDFKDQLQLVDLGGGGKAYYVYDAGGQRVRKVIDRQNGVRKEERLYLGGFELYREYDGNGETVVLERETLHVMDDKRRIAMVETQTIDAQSQISGPQPLTRYQLTNHLDSVSLELDEAGQIISYEEYYPYGSTSYQAVRSGVEVSQKRYRYTGKERDRESGLYYHGARYYAPWLGRWMSCDPAGMVDGPNLYHYSLNNPIYFYDPEGTQGQPYLSSTFSNEWIEEADKEARLQRQADYENELRKELEEKERLDKKHGRGHLEAREAHLAAKHVGMGERVESGGSAAVVGQILTNWLLDDVKPNAGDFKALADTAKNSTLNRVNTPKGNQPAARAAQTQAGKPQAPVQEPEIQPNAAPIRRQPMAVSPGGSRDSSGVNIGASSDQSTAIPPPGGSRKVLEVNTGSPAVEKSNCGQSVGAVLEGRGSTSTGFAQRAGGSEGLTSISNLKMQFGQAGVTTGPTLTANTQIDLVKGLKTYPAGTNVVVYYQNPVTRNPVTHQPDPLTGHYIGALVGKNKDIVFFDPQMKPIQVVAGPVPGASRFYFFAVTPAKR